MSDWKIKSSTPQLVPELVPSWCETSEYELFLRKMLTPGKVVYWDLSPFWSSSNEFCTAF